MANRKKDIGPCEHCKDSEEYEYHYWHGDIEEDYDMGIYTCLCYRCFGQLNKEGKIKWKQIEMRLNATSN